MTLCHCHIWSELQLVFRQAEPSALLPKPAAVLLLTPVTFCRGRVLAVGSSLPLCHRPTWSELRQESRQAKHSALRHPQLLPTPVALCRS